LYSCSNHPEDSQGWPKHVGGRYVIKLHSQNQSAFVGLSNKA